MSDCTTTHEGYGEVTGGLSCMPHTGFDAGPAAGLRVVLVLMGVLLRRGMR